MNNAPNYLVGCVISKRGRKTSRIAFSLWILEYYVYATHYIIGHSRIICRWKLRKNSEKYPWRNGIGTMANCCIVNCNWSSSLPPHYAAFHSLHILILTFLDFVLQWATKMFKKRWKCVKMYRSFLIFCLEQQVLVYVCIITFHLIYDGKYLKSSLKFIVFIFQTLHYLIQFLVHCVFLGHAFSMRWGNE